MKKTKENMIFKDFDGIMIIPIQGDEPVLVFKNLGKKFYEDYVDGDESGITDKGIISDFLVSWKGELLGHNLPLEVNEQYGDLFKTLIENSILYNIIDCNVVSLPSEVVELPLSIVIGNKDIKIFSPSYIKPVRDALRKLGLLKETRGKFKKEDVKKKVRNKRIIDAYKEIVSKTKKKRPYPVNSIFNKLIDDNMSFSTIRRVLDNFTKK